MIKFVAELYEVFKGKNPALRTVLGFGDIPLRSGELMETEVDNSALVRLGWIPLITIFEVIQNIITEGI